MLPPEQCDGSLYFQKGIIMLRYIDSHAHYDDKAFDADRDTLLPSLHDNNVIKLMNIGCTEKSSEASVKLAEKYDFVYAAVGIHPESTEDTDLSRIDDHIEKLAELLTHKKCVALGETGLDYYWDIPKEGQHILFDRQLRLAADIKKPIIIHDREAHGDTLGYLKKYRPFGLLHCYSGSVEMLREVFRCGDMMISLGGTVTFKNARVPVEVAKEVPLNRLLLETDAPYLAPVPFRGKRCDSSLIRHTADRIGEIRGMSGDDILRYTLDNARRFYNV